MLLMSEKLPTMFSWSLNKSNVRELQKMRLPNIHNRLRKEHSFPSSFHGW